MTRHSERASSRVGISARQAARKTTWTWNWARGHMPAPTAQGRGAQTARRVRPGAGGAGQRCAMRPHAGRRHARRLAHVGIGPPASAGDRGAVYELAAARMAALGPRAQGRRPTRHAAGAPGSERKTGAAGRDQRGTDSPPQAPPRGWTPSIRGRMAAAHGAAGGTPRPNGKTGSAWRPAAALGSEREACAVGRRSLRRLSRGQPDGPAAQEHATQRRRLGRRSAARMDALGPRSLPTAHHAAGGTPGGNGTCSAWRPAAAPGQRFAMRPRAGIVMRAAWRAFAAGRAAVRMDAFPARGRMPAPIVQRAETATLVRPGGRQGRGAAIRRSRRRRPKRHARRLAHVGIGPPAAAGDRGAVPQLAAARMYALGSARGRTAAVHAARARRRGAIRHPPPRCRSECPPPCARRGRPALRGRLWSRARLICPLSPFPARPPAKPPLAAAVKTLKLRELTSQFRAAALEAYRQRKKSAAP